MDVIIKKEHDLILRLAPTYSSENEGKSSKEVWEGATSEIKGKFERIGYIWSQVNKSEAFKKDWVARPGMK